MVCLQAEKDEPVTVNDFVERSEEFFGKVWPKTTARRKLQKYGDFEIKNLEVIPLENSDD